jgi:predicted MPP superfamily phosphohydrolase
LTDTSHPQTITRRDFLKLSGVTLLASLGVTVSCLSAENEIQTLVVEHVTLPVAGLPPALDGFRIAQVSDIHIGPADDVDLVQRAVARINALNPDLIVLTGDYTRSDLEAVFKLVPSLSQLNARYGVFAARGNHDLWENGVIMRAFEQMRIPLLVNQGVSIAAGSGMLYLAALDDGMSGHPDFAATMSGWREGAAVVLLLHEPDFAPAYAADGRIQLQLSGHSHGGQVRFPAIGPLFLPPLSRHYPRGLYHVQDMWLYTNRGLGTIVVPLRFNCAPEITEITLYRA